MKFLCLDCDEPMKLVRAEGPDEGSLSVTFRCPECGFRVAMLTNPFETQLVRSLGVKVGGHPEPVAPFEHLRSAMATQRTDVFDGAETAAPAPAGALPAAADHDSAGPGCPFAGLVNDGPRPAAEPSLVWDPEAEARVERIPAFIRPMARRAIERFAESQGCRTITEAVMDEARRTMGM
jgi:DNA-directed RNA polymerase subunit RPC12/RpoP